MATPIDYSRGIKCGACTGRHDTPAEVQQCYGEMEEGRAQAAAEQAAEMAVERYFEEGPHGPEPEDPREIEAQMRDDEAREAAAANLNSYGGPIHESPCVCSPYDRCNGVRAQNAHDSGNWRDRFRSYND